MVPAIDLPDVKIGFIILNSGQQLFFLGGIAIAIGIITYSERVMKTVGNNLMEISADTALVVVLSHSLVLFIFSSTALSNLFIKIGLPPIPLVPVSSSQVIVGAIVGIGLLKGGRNIKFKTLKGIFLGWIVTPVVACLISFVSLFFVQNVFDIDVSSTPESETEISINQNNNNAQES